MPDNAPPFEPLLSKSLCIALLDISTYFGENADQTMRVSRNFDRAVIVDAVRAEVAVEGRRPTLPVVEKTWTLPLDLWPRKTLPDDLGKLLTLVTLSDAVVQLRDAQSAFSVYVQKCLAADVPNPFAALAEVFESVQAQQAEVKLEKAAPLENLLRYSPVSLANLSQAPAPEAPTQTPG